MRMKMVKFLILTVGLFSWCSCYSKDFLITDFGARPGQANLNTKAINSAIMACTKDGGGRVIVPPGVFRSGTLVLQDNVQLYLESGAVLLASTDLNDFPLQPRPDYRSQKDPGGWHALIYASGVFNISINGYGTIDGNGALQRPDPNSNFHGDLDGRPRNILFISCQNVHIEGIKMLNSGIWNQHYLNCEDVTVDKIDVYNHANRNNDGIDIDGCRRFLLSNSRFDTDDDGIVLKSTGFAGCEDVVITNCIVSSFCNAIKTGTESTGGFKNISISNCVIKPSRSHNRISGTDMGIAGISLEIVDGGKMDGVTISNITIEGTECPIFVRLANRARKYIKEAPIPPVGTMRNIVISNIVAYHTGNDCSSITGIPGHDIENISLSNLQLFNIGGVKAAEFQNDPDKVKEEEKGYPQPTLWGVLPSSALFIRHAANVQIRGLILSSEQTDERVPIIATDVNGVMITDVNTIVNSGALVFFKGKRVSYYKVYRPLGWQKKVSIIEP